VNHNGAGDLRGFAYSANAGWLQLESNGAPRIDFKTGRLAGAAWSANCGWISLSNALGFVQTDRIEPGADTDADSITDAWELHWTGGLALFEKETDLDDDGATDREEYFADTNPVDPADALRITNFRVVSSLTAETNVLQWLVQPTRCYRVETRTNLGPLTAWSSISAVLSPDSGSTLAYAFTLSPGGRERYLRVVALKPLSP
jgi:hypothetical protein